jgi:hypothetical protein
MKKYISLFVLTVSLLIFASPSLLAHSPSQFLLTEDQAGNEEHPIVVPLHSEIEVKLLGSESNSHVYSSGSGSQHGERWECSWSNDDDDLMMIARPTAEIIHAPSNVVRSDRGEFTKSTDYRWTFLAQQSGVSTLIFKKYYYSNAKVHNLDDSSSWKDPIKEIHFTIQVTDSNEKGAE